MKAVYQKAVDELLSDNWDEVRNYAPDEGPDDEWTVTVGRDGIIVQVSHSDRGTIAHVESMKTRSGINVYTRAHELAGDQGVKTGVFDNRIDHNSDPEVVEPFLNGDERVQWNVHAEFEVESPDGLDNVLQAFNDVQRVVEGVESVHPDAFEP